MRRHLRIWGLIALDVVVGQALSIGLGWLVGFPIERGEPMFWMLLGGVMLSVVLYIIYFSIEENAEEDQ